ncbi:MAG: hypothetical protein JXA78_00620 [Anaerolineales bacterium]|nr:hypothetical protein [Anaerolineales bacterium]
MATRPTADWQPDLRQIGNPTYGRLATRPTADCQSTGQKVSPPLFESMRIIGEQKVLARLQWAIEKRCRSGWQPDLRQIGNPTYGRLPTQPTAYCQPDLRQVGNPTYGRLATRPTAGWQPDLRQIGNSTYGRLATRPTAGWQPDLRQVGNPTYGRLATRPTAGCQSTGQKVSPPLFESMQIIGKQKVLARLQWAIEKRCRSDCQSDLLQIACEAYDRISRILPPSPATLAT